MVCSSNILECLSVWNRDVRGHQLESMAPKVVTHSYSPHHSSDSRGSFGVVYRNVRFLLVASGSASSEIPLASVSSNPSQSRPDRSVNCVLQTSDRDRS